MHVVVTRKAANTFRKAARECYPIEEFGILMGEVWRDAVLVKDIYFPPNRAEKTTTIRAGVSLSWFDDAHREFHHTGLTPVGDIHSHCLTAKEQGVQHEPSESDWKSARTIYENGITHYCTFGICRVMKTKGGKLRTTIKFWPLLPEVHATIIDGEGEE